MPITINGSGTVTGIAVGGLPDGIVDNDTIANSTIAAGKCSFSPGKILQVVQTKRTSAQGYSNIDEGVFTSVGVSADITPSSANNFILIQANINASTSGNHDVRTQIFKGGSVLATSTGDADSSKTRATSSASRGNNAGSTTLTCLHLDPCTVWTSGALTYEIKVGHWDNSSIGVGVNHTWDWDSNNNAWVARVASHLILMEVAA